MYSLKRAVTEADYAEAVRHVRECQVAKTAEIYRHLGIGYNDAARLMVRMEKYGVVSACDALGRRKIYDTQREEPKG